MPIYEYQCPACGEFCEFLQKVSDDPITECPHCHEHQLKKQISATSFQLKGTGWYVTDFKNKDQAKQSDKSEQKTQTGKEAGSAKKDNSGKKEESAK